MTWVPLAAHRSPPLATEDRDDRLLAAHAGVVGGLAQQPVKAPPPGGRGGLDGRGIARLLLWLGSRSCDSLASLEVKLLLQLAGHGFVVHSCGLLTAASSLLPRLMALALQRQIWIAYKVC